MGVRFQNAVAWTIGPTVWISSVVLMIHGLWTGEWYGYLLASVLGVGVGIILVAMSRIDREIDVEIERIAREE